MATTATSNFKYPESAKMPKGYNFSTKGKLFTHMENPILQKMTILEVRLEDTFSGEFLNI